MFRSSLIFTIILCLSGMGYSPAMAADSTTSARISNRVALDFSGALSTVGGRYGGTFLTGVTLPISRTSPVRLGFDTGVMFSSGVGLPILLSILYQVGEGRGATPYIGGAIGPVIVLSRGQLGNLIAQNYNTEDVALAILLRPGIKFPMTEVLDLTIEAPLGGLTGIFYIAPTLGIQLKV